MFLKKQAMAMFGYMRDMLLKAGWHAVYLMYFTRSRAHEKPPSTTVKVSWPLGGSPLSARMFWIP